MESGWRSRRIAIRRFQRFSRSNFVVRLSTEIYVVRPDGSGLRRITHDDEFAGSPAWSPDGRSLVFYTASAAEMFRLTSVRRLGGTTQIESVNLKDGQRRVLTTAAGEKFSPRWLTPDRIGYAGATAAGGIDFASAAGGAVTAGARGVFRHPSWSRDGKRMVFQRDAPETWPPNQAWPSRDERFSLLRVGVFASYSPTGDRRVSNDKTCRQLAQRDPADERGRQQCARDLQRRRQECHGSHLVTSGRSNRICARQIFSEHQWPAAGRHRHHRPRRQVSFTILTDGKANYAMPSWSGDGKHIVYRRAGASGNALEIVDVETRAQRVLTTGPGPLQPARLVTRQRRHPVHHRPRRRL